MVTRIKRNFKLLLALFFAGPAILSRKGHSLVPTSPSPHTCKYHTSPYNNNIPVSWNVMKCDTFTFMRQYLTSCNNHTHKKKGGREYNSLQKVLHPLKKMIVGMCWAWVSGKLVTLTGLLLSGCVPKTRKKTWKNLSNSLVDT